MHAYRHAFSTKDCTWIEVMCRYWWESCLDWRSSKVSNTQTKDTDGGERGWAGGGTGFSHWLLNASLPPPLVCQRPYTPHSVKPSLRWERFSLLLRTGFMALRLLFLTSPPLPSSPTAPGSFAFGATFQTSANMEHQLPLRIRNKRLRPSWPSVSFSFARAMVQHFAEEWDLPGHFSSVHRCLCVTWRWFFSHM